MILARTRAHVDAARLAVFSVYALIALYAIFFSFLSIRRHDALQSFGYDLGIFDQVIWNTAHGRWFANTVMEDSPNFLGHHYAPLLIALTPLYWLWEDARMLLIAQSVVLALGALPVYWLARERIGARYGVAFAAAYLLFPSLQAGNLFDFHEVALAVPLLAFATYFLLKRRDLGFAICALLAMQAKEDIPLLVAMMGLYALVVQRRWKFGLAWIAASAAIFATAVYVIIPRAIEGSAHPFLSYYKEFGTTPLEIIWNVVTQPAHTLAFLGPGWSLAYLLELLSPFGLLPLVAPLELLLLLPTLAINWLSNFTAMHRLALQYPLALTPFVAMAGVAGAARAAGCLERFRLPANWARGLVTAAVFAGALLAQRAHGLSPFSAEYYDYPPSPHTQLLNRLAARIPPEASVSAQPNLLSHLTHRTSAHTLERLDSDYILLDIATIGNKDNLNRWVRDVLFTDYALEAAEDGYMLLRRGKSDTRLAPEFFTFASADSSTITQRVTARFGDAIELLGYDVRYFPWELYDEPQVMLYLRALRPLDRDYFFSLYLLDEEGQVVGASTEPPATLVWYPTSQWRPGQVVRVNVNSMPWWTGKMPRFALALGVVDGDDPWDTGARLAPQPLQSPYATALPADGTLLQIATFSNDLLMRRQFAPEPPLSTLPQGATKLDQGFGEAVALRGYRIDQDRSRLRVILYWQALAPATVDYTVFVHLLDASGRLLAQSDSPPNHGNTPTHVWAPGEIIADEHLIVLGNYTPTAATIEIGLYDALTGVRSKTLEGQDHVLLTSVTLP